MKIGSVNGARYNALFSKHYFRTTVPFEGSGCSLIEHKQTAIYYTKVGCIYKRCKHLTLNAHIWFLVTGKPCSLIRNQLNISTILCYYCFFFNILHLHLPIYINIVRNTKCNTRFVSTQYNIIRSFSDCFRLLLGFLKL